MRIVKRRIYKKNNALSPIADFITNGVIPRGLDGVPIKKHSFLSDLISQPKPINPALLLSNIKK